VHTVVAAGTAEWYRDSGVSDRSGRIGA
jgi:hypothetical protein